jgi:hypothetical protein
MFSLKYSKRFSFRNKNSDANQTVNDNLIRLNSKSEKENSMRINVFRDGTFEFPYALTITRKEINDNSAMIEVIVRVKTLKLILLTVFSGILVSVLLYLTFKSYWVLFPAFFYSLIFHQIGRRKVWKFTERLVNGWFDNALEKSIS